MSTTPEQGLSQMNHAPTSNLDVLLERLNAIKEGQDEIKQDLRLFRVQYTTLTLWEQRNATVDERFQSQGREIADLRTEQRAKRVSWPAVGSFVVSAAALLIVLIQSINP